MTHGIASLELLQGEARPKNWHIKVLLKLSKEDHDRCVQACFALDDYRTNTQLFQAVRWNLEDFHAYKEEYLKAFISKDFESLPRRQPNVNFNRLMSNWLSSVRMYLDHVETFTKEKYGHEAENARQFLQDCSRAYDASFSYRFLYKLRNYAQHYGPPLTVMDYKAKASEDKSGESYYEILVGIERDKLLGRKFGWGKIYKEISEQPPVIDIVPHMDEIMEHLKEIHTHFIASEFVGLRESAAYLRSFLQRIPGDYEELYIFTYDGEPQGASQEEQTDRRIGFRLQPIPLELVNEVFDERFAALFAVQGKERAEIMDSESKDDRGNNPAVELINLNENQLMEAVIHYVQERYGNGRVVALDWIISPEEGHLLPPIKGIAVRCKAEKIKR